MYCAVRRNRRESGVATGGDELSLLACGSLATLRWRHRRWGVAVVDSGSQSPKAVGGSVFFLRKRATRRGRWGGLFRRMGC